VTARSKIGFSAVKPGAITQITAGMATIISRVNGTSTISRQACACRANTSAASRPSPCSSRANSGTKAAEKAPSAKRRRNRLGSLKATMKASATGPDPSTADRTISRPKPTMRDSKVKKPTVAMERPKLIKSLPQCCHHRSLYSLRWRPAM
jgi:hypothetical protein